MSLIAILTQIMYKCSLLSVIFSDDVPGTSKDNTNEENVVSLCEWHDMNERFLIDIK